MAAPGCPHRLPSQIRYAAATRRRRRLAPARHLHLHRLVRVEAWRRGPSRPTRSTRFLKKTLRRPIWTLGASPTAWTTARPTWPTPTRVCRRQLGWRTRRPAPPFLAPASKCALLPPRQNKLLHPMRHRHVRPCSSPSTHHEPGGICWRVFPSAVLKRLRRWADAYRGSEAIRPRTTCRIRSSVSGVCEFAPRVAMPLAKHRLERGSLLRRNLPLALDFIKPFHVHPPFELRFQFGLLGCLFRIVIEDGCQHKDCVHVLMISSRGNVHRWRRQAQVFFVCHAMSVERRS
ncbi:hypothetical protein SRABI118_02430 [Massilia sp. Bi118]|nr:hypothetical protein SRABI118_02430 [Massilia sp. Bi118]